MFQSTSLITDQPNQNDECILNPDGVSYTCGTNTSVYSIFARALGNPRGTAVMMLCGLVDPTDPTTQVCSTTNQLTLDASGRPAKFRERDSKPAVSLQRHDQWRLLQAHLVIFGRLAGLLLELQQYRTKAAPVALLSLRHGGTP